MKLKVRDMDNIEMWAVQAQIWDKEHCDNPIEICMEPDGDYTYSAEVNMADYDITDAYIEITCQEKNGMKYNYLDWKGDLNLLKEDLSGYMSYVSGLDDVIILMSVKNDRWLAKDEEVLQILNRYGIKRFGDIGEHEAYYSVIIPEEVFEDCGAEELSYTGEYNGTLFEIKNAGWDSGYYSSIVVNDEEHSRGECGINIVVYDTKTKKLIDSVNYNYYIKGGDRKILLR